MGTDINGIFSHRKAFPATEALARNMNAGVPRVNELIHNEWRLDPRYSTEPYRGVHDPRGLSVWFGPHAAKIVSGLSWYEAAENHEFLLMVKSAMCAIARFFQSPRVIFYPDDSEPWTYVADGVQEGATLEAIQERMAHIREPCPNFRAAWPDDRSKVDGYVIEELSYDEAPLGSAGPLHIP